MRKFALITLSAAALLFTAGAASAQVYYSGPGFGLHIGPQYDDRYERRRYRDDRRYYGERRYDRRVYRSGRPCPPRYSVQDGVCKPYTGR